MRRPFLPADAIRFKFLHMLSDKVVDVRFVHTSRAPFECGNITGSVALSSAQDFGKPAS